jgi:type I restriction enzyme S subunit
MNTKRAPKVRFKGFTDAWELRKFESIAARASSISADPTLPRVEYEDIISGIGLLNKDVKLKGISKPGIVFNQGDILYGKLRPYLHNWFLPSFSGLAVGDFWVLQPKDADSSFLFRLIQGQQFDDVANQSIGTKMPRADWNLVSKTLFFVPTSIDEQALIGRYFRSIDNLITLHQRKLDKTKKLKKAFLNLIFGQKLRFYGFNDSWELRKLGEVVTRVQGNDGRMNLPTLTISASNGWLDQRDRFSSNIAGNEQKNYTLLKKGELSYNHGNSKLAKYGTVFVLRNSQEALVPRVYHSFKTTLLADADFIEYIFSTKNPDRELAKLISSGARMDGLLNISYDDFIGIKISLPQKVEQQKIALFFRSIDNLITLHQEKINQLTKLKTTFLKNMFI